MQIRSTLKIKNGYSLKLLTTETMKLLGSTENKIIKDQSGENVPNLEITEVVLVYSNIVNNYYQQDSRVLYTFVTNKPLVVYYKFLPQIISFLKTFKSEFQTIEVWFIDRNSQPFEIEENKYNFSTKIKHPPNVIPSYENEIFN